MQALLNRLYAGVGKDVVQDGELQVIAIGDVVRFWRRA